MEKYMIIFKSNKELSREEWEMWQSAITIHHENNTPLLIPDFIDIYEFEEGEEVEYEES